MEKETGKSLKILHTDRGGKNTSTTFSSFLAECGIKCETTNTYTPQENGVSECTNHTINNLARSLLADVKEVLREKALPMALWFLAVTHAVWIKNCVFTCSLEPSNSPFHVYFGKKPNLSSVHLFGCKAYLHIPKINQSKLGEHSIECVHVSFALEKSAYMLYNREQRHLFKS